MNRKIVAAVASASLAILAAGSALSQPAPRREGPPGGRYADFDVRNARTWAERLVLCDTTAFLASRPDMNADRMWVRRDDGRRDLMLPPDFVGGGRWYKEGYERLFWRLRRERQVSSDELYRTQSALARRFVEVYRRSNGRYGLSATEQRFLDAQDTYCRSMARREGAYVD
jgi:hypothetical protein